MRRSLVIATGIATSAMLLAGTGFASAQVPDDPPGWAFQWRGIQEERGYHPDEVYGGYGYYGDGAIVSPQRYYYGGYRSYRASPPGAGIQDRGIRNEHGEH